MRGHEISIADGVIKCTDIALPIPVEGSIGTLPPPPQNKMHFIWVSMCLARKY